MIELYKFFTGQYCECGGEIWSDTYGYSCKECNKKHIISPKTQLHIKFVDHESKDDNVKEVSE